MFQFLEIRGIQLILSQGLLYSVTANQPSIYLYEDLFKPCIRLLKMIPMSR